MARHVITPLYACSFELSHDEYQARYNDLAADGYRLIMVDGYRSNQLLYYGGIWIRDQAAVLTRAQHGLTSSQYQSAFDDLNLRGYQLAGITGLSSASGSTAATFAAVWNDGSWRGFHTHHQMTASEYQAQFDEYAADGYQLIYVTGYASGTSSRYAAIWSSHSNRVQAARHNLPSANYQATFDDLKSQGYRIAHVNAHEAGGRTYFAGIWVKEDGYEPTGQHNMSPDSFKDQCLQMARDDMRLTCMGGYREAGQDRYTAIWTSHKRTWLVHGRAHSSLTAFDSAVQSYMMARARTIPGGSLAVTRNGELVLARGYSWITELETPVEPTSLFRLASVSKTLTGAAIVLLAEEGRLSFSDKLVNLIDMPGTIADVRTNDIKVEHLLYHVGGWDRDVLDVDPMSSDEQIAADLNIPLPISREAIIRWTNAKGLDYDPGKVNGWTYSNYGYMLLGEIIETVSGLPYETFVQQRLLAPLGIRRMRLGRTLLRNRLQGEVLYHSTDVDLYKNLVAEGAPQNVMHQYGGHRSIENIAAHGGWVGTAVDLVRFASSFDDPVSCPILSASSVARLFAAHAYGNLKKDGISHYGCGWYVDRGGPTPGQSHGGTIEGTKTQLARWQDSTTGDSFCAALLFNKYDGSLEWDLLGLIRHAADRISSWPAGGFWADYI